MQILTVEEFKRITDGWSNRPAPFVDFEHNAKDFYDPAFRIVCLSLTGVHLESMMIETIQIPLAHQTGENAEQGMQEALAEFFSKAPLEAFYVQSDSICVRKFGVRGKFVGDPYVMLRLIQDSRSKSLKDGVLNHLGVQMTRIEEVLGYGNGFDFSTVDAQDPKAVSYSEQDSLQGYHLSRVLEQRIEKSKMQAVYQVEVAAAQIMAEQSLLGYDISLPILEMELANEELALKELENQIFKLMECEPFKLNSGPKLGAALAKKGIYTDTKTDKGADSWAMPVMEAMIKAGMPKEQADILKPIMDWKSRFSTRNTLRKSPTRIAPDGKIHPNWAVIGFDGTARMYAEDPSITSLPQGCRRAMLAPAGKRWMKFDWKQAELRALAAASGDKVLIELLNSGDDPHRLIYSRMSGVPVEEVTEEQREESKVITYSILYSGGSAYHVARSLGISMEDASAAVRQYLDNFRTLSDFLDGVRSRAAESHRVRTFMNRVRRLNGTSTETIMNQACDAMGQQSIGTALKVALIKMNDFFLQNHPAMKGLCQIIPVFDAIFYCIDADVPVRMHVEVMKDLVQLNMAGVILEADFAVGPSWGTLVKISSPEFAQAAADLTDGNAAVDRWIEKNVPRGTFLPLEQGAVCNLCNGTGSISIFEPCPRGCSPKAATATA